ncbi:MAG: hypothetical protein Q8K96_05885 [Rubrivivax sp.]|nr:hypothetical protein [Rubrivivax sp.]
MLHGRATRLALVLLLALAGTACSTLRGTPERYQSTESVVASIDLTADDVAALAVADNQTERNRLQNKALAVIDLRFHDFVRALAADRADGSATVAGTTLGASTAGAFVDSVKAKTNYALFAAGVVGAFGIVDKNYFYEKTVPALVAGMRAARAKVLLRMRQGQIEALANYNGVAALQDLEDYYTAGTVLAAIAEVTARAEDDAALALGQVRALEVPSDAEIANRKTLSQAIFGIQDEAAMAKGNVALKALGLSEQATPKATRAALVRALQPRTPERIATVEKALKTAGLLK